MDTELKPFVTEYSFSEFRDAKSVLKFNENKKVKNFNFQQLKETLGAHEQDYESMLEQERNDAKNSGFKIASIVRKHRGIKRKEQENEERIINEEVQKRYLEVKNEAYALGYEEGVKKGQAEVFEQTIKSVEEKLLVLSEMINEVLAQKNEILSRQRIEIYTMVRNLTKWVILRELEGDGEYLSRLLEKLVTELQTKNNIFIQVSSKQFDKMPEVLEIVQKKLGEFKNYRVEVDYDINDQGLVVDSDNGIIVGTLEQQFESIDKLFKSLGVGDGKSSS